MLTIARKICFVSVRCVSESIVKLNSYKYSESKTSPDPFENRFIGISDDSKTKFISGIFSFFKYFLRNRPFSDFW